MSKDIWQLQEAKNRFSLVVNKAMADGPQIITRRGEEVAVLVSKDDYERLKKSRLSLVEFFRQSPLVGVPLELERDRTRPRDLDL